MVDKNVRSLIRVIEKHRQELAAESRVKQIGVGFKIKNRKITDTVAIIIFVTNRPTNKQLRDQHIQPIPKEIDGVATDIIEIPGGFQLRRLPDDTRHRPFQGGVAVINSRTPATGTLGIVVKRKAGEKGNSSKLYALTNNHVGANEDVEGMSPPAAKKGDPWIQPGVHGKGRVPHDVIAKLYEWNRIKPSAPGMVNYYDAAIGEIVAKSVKDATANEIMEIGRVKGADDINLGDKVMKRGRTTGKTIGTVISIMQTVSVEFNSFPCDFVEQVTIAGNPPSKPFSQPGDSGSVIVSQQKDRSTNAYKAMALLFAGAESEQGIDITVASPMRKVANDFRLGFD